VKTPMKSSGYRLSVGIVGFLEGERATRFEPAHANVGFSEKPLKPDKEPDKIPDILPGDNRPTEACRWCLGREFWRKPDGPWICERCHPPVADPAERCTLPGVDPATWTRAVTPNSRHPLIPDAVREKIAAIEPTARNLGWPPELLWNANFWDAPRGLAAVLDEGDEIAEVTADYIGILKVKHDLLKFRRFAA
jgi:hypothetical protein